MRDCEREINIARGCVVERETEPEYDDQKNTKGQSRRDQLRKTTRMARDRHTAYIPDSIPTLLGFTRRCDQRQRQKPNAVMQHLEKNMSGNEHAAGNVWQQLGAGVLRDAPEESVIIRERRRARELPEHRKQQQRQHTQTKAVQPQPLGTSARRMTNQKP